MPETEPQGVAGRVIRESKRLEEEDYPFPDLETKAEAYRLGLNDMYAELSAVANGVLAELDAEYTALSETGREGIKQGEFSAKCEGGRLMAERLGLTDSATDESQEEATDGN